MKKYIYVSLVPLFCLVLILSGCNDQESVNNYYLSLKGESENWNLVGYEIEITPEKFKAGNGTLNMKNENEYITDSFDFDTHAVINNEDITVHSGSITGIGIDVAEETTGSIEGGSYLNENGNPITLNEVNDIYMIIEWWDMNKNDSTQERIDLYNKPKKERTS